MQPRANAAEADAPRCVLLVDDHALFRLGLMATLQQQRRPIRILEASNGAAALASLAEAPIVHLIVYDWSLPQGGGLDGLRALQRQAPGVPVLVMSGLDAQVYGLAAATAGAEFLSKGEEPELVRQTLARLLARPPAAAHPDTSEHLPPLTPRQREVLHLLARGWPNKRIARELGVSDHTINAHVTDILRLLDVDNRTEAVLVAGRLGLIDLPHGSNGAAD